MPRTNSKGRPPLAIVRRFEAAGFRAWPAASVHYDGTWAIRLTAGHPAKRLNSVNPLDPGDIANPAERIARAARRFDAYGRPLTFRMSPLSGNALASYLDSEGWSHFAESLVMRLDLEKAALDEAIDQIPLKDIGRFLTAAMAVHGRRPGCPAGSVRDHRIDRSRGRAVRASRATTRPLASAICVHDGDLAGLFEIATECRRAAPGPCEAAGAIGIEMGAAARRALRLAAGRGRQPPALALYRLLGFDEIYRYHYRQPPGA